MMRASRDESHKTKFRASRKENKLFGNYRKMAEQDTGNKKGQSGNPPKQTGSRKKKGPNNNRHDNNSDKKPTSQNQSSQSKKEGNYAPHLSYDECFKRYIEKDGMIRGKLRVISKDGASFVSCDRGLYRKDVCILTVQDRNRALHGDIVFCEIVSEGAGEEEKEGEDVGKQLEQRLNLEEAPAGEETTTTWQDDAVQMDLWNPVVNIRRRQPRKALPKEDEKQSQVFGRIVYICPPKAIQSELGSAPVIPRRRIVGSLKVLQSGTTLLTPSNKGLPQFKCPPTKNLESSEDIIYQAEYEFGSWKQEHKWPPCINLKRLGQSGDMEDEIQSLLLENGVDHGDFTPEVMRNVNDAVERGCYTADGDLGWKPTPDMYKGRRDFRDERIFTIDPTTAKDLDDALQ
jgi:exoribonuclease R